MANKKKTTKEKKFVNPMAIEVLFNACGWNISQKDIKVIDANQGILEVKLRKNK